MTNPTDKTDLIAGLRASDTPPMPLPLPASHRRRRRDVPRWAWIAIWGAPAAVAAGLVGWSLGGTPHGKPPAAVASSPSRSDSPAAVSPAPLPSTADAPASSLPATHTAPKSSPTQRATRSSSPRPTASPSPTRTRTVSPAPAPTRTHEEPSPAPTDTDAPPTLFPPTITPEATDGH